MRYLKFRIRQSLVLQHSFPDQALVEVILKVRVIRCTLFGPQCDSWVHRGFLFPWPEINLAAFIAGVYSLIKKIGSKKNKDKEKKIYLFFLIFVIFSLYITGVYLPLNSDRYYLPMVVSVYLVEFLGIKVFLEVIRRQFFSPLHRCSGEREGRLV